MQAQPPMPVSAQMSPTGGRLAVGCVTAISLPFLIFGVVMIKQGITKLTAGDSDAWVLTAAGVAFAGMAIFLILAASYGMRHAAHEATVRQQSPDKPWLWREDWALGYARETRSTASMVAFWMFTLVWNAISLPVGFVGWREYQNGNAAALLIAIFPAVGACMLIAALVTTLRRQRYGEVVCHFEGLPLALGHTIRGDIELKADIQPSEGFVVRFVCVNAVTTGTSRSRSTTEKVLWDEQKVVPVAATRRSPLGTRIPFDFVAPPDAPVTDARNMNDKTFWRLSVYADVPGFDLDSSFELPVFAVGPPPAKGEKGEFVTYAEAHRAVAAQRELDRRSGVIISETADGEEYLVKSHPTFGGVIGLLIFLSLWSGAVYAMVRFKVPIGFPIVFGLIDLLLVYGMFDYLFGRSTIRASREGVGYRRSIFLTGAMTHVAAKEVDRITGHADSENDNFSVELKRRDGTRHDIARFLRTRADADTVAAKIERALGR